MSSAEIQSASAGQAPETIPLSALNHHLYCERRAYLIHAERGFVDNEHTLLGVLAHEHVDTPGYEQRAGWELLRALPLFSDTLGLTGKADLVEIRRADFDPSQISNFKSQITRPVIAARPVEYKKGPVRRWANDRVQLCAQALCLEEMFGLRIESGLIYHVASAKREEVIFDAELRGLTLSTISNLKFKISNPVPPPAELKPQCEGCSLHEVCFPEATNLKSVRVFEPRTY